MIYRGNNLTTSVGIRTAPIAKASLPQFPGQGVFASRPLAAQGSNAVAFVQFPQFIETQQAAIAFRMSQDRDPTVHTQAKQHFLPVGRQLQPGQLHQHALAIPTQQFAAADMIGKTLVEHVFGGKAQQKSSEVQFFESFPKPCFEAFWRVVWQGGHDVRRTPGDQAPFNPIAFKELTMPWASSRERAPSSTPHRMWAWRSRPSGKSCWNSRSRRLRGWSQSQFIREGYSLLEIWQSFSLPTRSYRTCRSNRSRNSDSELA